MRDERDRTPGISRGEYLLLLEAARESGKERTYLIIKSVALMGLRVEELPLVTAEAARKGMIVAHDGGVPVPEPLREELLSYAWRKGMASGPLFVTRNGRNVDRSNITNEIAGLGEKAGIGAGKCTPRALKRLYGETQEKIRSDLEAAVLRAYASLIEGEQTVAGWHGTRD